MKRGFADLADRQVHFRHAGEGSIPLVMLHGSPGSSKQLERLADAVARTRWVIAPDRPGNGDSPALPLAEPDIADYASADLAFLDAIGVDAFDVYGSHTGANVAIEVALQAPGRVRRVVLDGIGLFPPALAAHFLAQYAPAVTPDLAGLHLQWAFQFCRDQALFFPWFEPLAQNARGLGLPPAQGLHDFVLEVLKSIGTYHLGYNASFCYDPAPRLPLLQQPVLAVSSADDPLLCYLGEALALMPHAVTGALGSLRAPGVLDDFAGLIAGFLDGTLPSSNV
jgi:pimeloyl-ACP methyl ester carboxylesterase